MKMYVLSTDTSNPRVLTTKRIFCVALGPRGATMQSRTVLISTPRSPSEMFRAFEDGTCESDVRDTIRAAALAGNWDLARETAATYCLYCCLYCASDLQGRPTWQLADLEIDRWGEVCGSCALKLLKIDE